MSELNVGTKIKDRYTLKEFKGSGTFGEVWLAHDDVLDCDVAVKIYISLDPRGVEEFKNEYITTQDISHPNLLTTSYFDVWEQRPFLVMKYCSKGSSSSAAGNIDESTLWKFIRDVSAGLNYLHSLPEPVIHQDIKPDNILVDDTDHFLITDFGISKKVRSTMRRQSKRAVSAGATAYMGPERFDSDPTPIKASDIWSLGASIYELATGDLPFSGLGGVMQKNGADTPALNQNWSDEINMVMQSCLAKDPWDRPTAQQLQDYSDAILKGQPAKKTWADGYTPAPSGNDVNTPSSNKKNLWIGLGAAGVSVIIAIIILAAFCNRDNKPAAATDDQPLVESATIAEEVIEVSDVEEQTSAQTDPDSDNKKLEDEKAAKKAEADRKAKEEEAKKAKPEETKPTGTEGPSTTKAEEPKVETDASLLKKALANGNYDQVKKLANKGYAPAYGPLAKYYFRTNNYKLAESFAIQAKAAGYSEGNEVLQSLKNIGYFD